MEDSDSSSAEEYPLHAAAEVGNAELLAALLSKRVKAQRGAAASAEVRGSVCDGVHSAWRLDRAARAAPIEEASCLPSRLAHNLHQGQPAEPADTDDDVDVDERDDDCCTPLHVALLSGNLECFQLLLEAGAQLSIHCEGSPLLHIATCLAALPHSRKLSLEAVKLLLASRETLAERDDSLRTALHWAAAEGLLDIAQLLLDADSAHRISVAANGQPNDSVIAPPALAELQDRQGNTAVHLAARFRHPVVLSLLLQMSGDRPVSLKNKVGQHALHLAAQQGCWGCARLLSSAFPAALGVVDRRGNTPADWARKRGHEVLAAALVMGFEGAAPLPPRRPQTLIVAPPLCLEHRTCPEPITRASEPPPENVKRLHVLTAPGSGILRAAGFAALEWEQGTRLAPIGDVLRVHEWSYVRSLQHLCSAIPDTPGAVGHLDGDTAISHGTFQAALAAAGGVCEAIDRVVQGKSRNAFCAIRPPGHHAGPTGVVTCENDPHGSHGFCLFNNLAIGGAYAVNTYRHEGIRRVAILDFDVHHGNGTEACVGAATPVMLKYSFKTPFSEGSQLFPSFRPWLDFDDSDNILFASVQGYGQKVAGMDLGWVYPGSGGTCDSRPPMKPAFANGGDQADAVTFASPDPSASDAGPSTDAPGQQASGVADRELTVGIEEDPDAEFRAAEGPVPPATGPRVINVGIHGPGAQVALWRRAWRDKILPAVVRFKPDLILVSAGFDAHKKDDINFRYIGIQEKEYEWLTDQLVQVANRCCNGRIVSALEGGYRIQGGIVSAFTRSVAAHVHALMDPNFQSWDASDAQYEREKEKQRRLEIETLKRKAVEEAAARLAAAEENPANQGRTGQDSSAAAAFSPPDAADNGGSSERKRRRRGEPVDYVQLNAQLEREKAVG